MSRKNMRVKKLVYLSGAIIVAFSLGSPVRAMENVNDDNSVPPPRKVLFTKELVVLRQDELSYCRKLCMRH